MIDMLRYNAHRDENAISSPSGAINHERNPVRRSRDGEQTRVSKHRSGPSADREDECKGDIQNEELVKQLQLVRSPQTPTYFSNAAFIIGSAYVYMIPVASAL